MYQHYLNRPDNIAEWEIEELDLRIFTYKQLKKAGIEYIGQLLEKDVIYFNDLNPFSRLMFREMVEALDGLGLRRKGYGRDRYDSVEPCIRCYNDTERKRWEEELAQLEEEEKVKKRERAKIRARERRALVKAARAPQISA